jgi:hypothetical protein
MEYKQLTDLQQRSMLEQRQIGLEQEHFNHTVNLELLETTVAAAKAEGKRVDADTQKALDDTKAAIATIESAHEEVTKLISDIPEDVDKPDTGDGSDADTSPPEPKFNPVKTRASRRQTAAKSTTAGGSLRDSPGGEG